MGYGSSRGTAPHRPPGFAQAGQQAVEIQRVAGCVVVGVFTHFQTRRIKHALMVRPAWIAYPHTLHRSVFAEICRHAQCAGTAGVCAVRARFRSQWCCLCRTAAPGAATKFRDTINTEVVLVVSFSSRYCSAFDAGQYRSFAGFIFIYTNTRVDFSGRSSARNRSAGPELGRQERQ